MSILLTQNKKLKTIRRYLEHLAQCPSAIFIQQSRTKSENKHQTTVFTLLLTLHEDKLYKSKISE